MKSLIYLISGIAAATAYMIIKQRQAAAAALPAPVDELAHKLQDAWADHHTTV